MDKKTLFSIGTIAKAVGITRKTILNYESKGLIKPDKKGKVGKANGFRRFRNIIFSAVQAGSGLLQPQRVAVFHRGSARIFSEQAAESHLTHVA